MLVRKERGPGGLSVPKCSPSSCSELGWSRARRPVLEGAGGLRKQSLCTGTHTHLTHLLVLLPLGAVRAPKEKSGRSVSKLTPLPPLCKKIGFSAYSADGICPEESRAHFKNGTTIHLLPPSLPRSPPPLSSLTQLKFRCRAQSALWPLSRFIVLTRLEHSGQSQLSCLSLRGQT